LAARGAPTILVGVGGAIASALATWRLADFVRAELADRRRLRFPPAVRVVSVTGAASAVESALGALELGPTVDVLGPTEDSGGGMRAIVRFDYGEGARVAALLRAEVIRNATSRRRRPVGAAAEPPLPTLKVRFDDTEPFAE
jgi:primosomal protein N' (replication factor Y)